MHWLMQEVEAMDPEKTWSEVSLVIIGHVGIAAIHAAYLGSHQETDVISFAYPPAPPAVGGYTGEVIVNIERVMEEGPRHRGVAWEWALYIAHGCQHLTGAEDHTPALKARMRRVENRWLKKAAAMELIEPLHPRPRR